MPRTSPDIAARTRLARAHAYAARQCPHNAPGHLAAVAKLARQRRLSVATRKARRYLAPAGLPLGMAGAMLALALPLALVASPASDAAGLVALLLAGAVAFGLLGVASASLARRDKLARQARRARVAGIVATSRATIAASRARLAIPR